MTTPLEVAPAGQAVLKGYVVLDGRYWFTQRSWKSLHVPMDLKPIGQPPWVPAAAFSHVCVSALQNCDEPHCEW